MTGPVPGVVVQDLEALGAALDAAIPPRTAGNLLVATWNLRAFGDLSRKWQAGPNHSPKRDWHAVACIAAITGRFDVIALQEIRRSTGALRFLLARLGTSWHIIASDVTEGAAGNGERLAFLYNAERIQPSGLVGEIVLPPGMAGSTLQQFARTPYFAGFTRDGTEFTLASVHIRWGTKAAERLPEILGFAKWMRAWADRPNDWNSNLMVLGDFNLDRIGDPLFEAFVSTGLWPPAELNLVPRTIFDNDRTHHFYDQIAWFSRPDGAPLLRSIIYSHRAGYFDFVPIILRGLDKESLSWRISDHYPLWSEFTITP